jgi:hypothetical protein
MSDWYQITGTPGFKDFGSSAAVRAEFQLVSQAMGKLPALTGNANKFMFINGSGTAVTVISGADARQALGLEIGVDVQGYSEILQNTTASFTTEMKTVIEETVPSLSSTVSGLATSVGEIQQAVTDLEEAEQETGSDVTALTNRVAAEHDEDGLHKQVTLPVSGSDVTPSSDQIVIYSKTVDGLPELFINGPGVEEPIRLTNNGGKQLSISLPETDVIFDSIRTRSFMRGTVVDVPVIDGEATIDWSIGTVFRLVIEEDIDLYLTNMPDVPSGEEQTIYVDVTTSGARTIFMQSEYELEFPLEINTGVTPDGRDFFICASNNGTRITVVPLTNLGTGA